MFTAIHRARRSKGFTLVELLLVIAIIAILAFLAIPRIVSSIRNAREKTCLGQVQMVEEAINRYHADKIAQAATPEWPWNFGVDPVPASKTAGPAGNITLCTGGVFDPTDIVTDFHAYFKAAPRCPFDPTGSYSIFVWQPAGESVRWDVICDEATVAGVGGNPPTHP